MKYMKNGRFMLRELDDAFFSYFRHENDGILSLCYYFVPLSDV